MIILDECHMHAVTFMMLALIKYFYHTLFNLQGSTNLIKCFEFQKPNLILSIYCWMIFLLSLAHSPHLRMHKKWNCIKNYVLIALNFMLSYIPMIIDIFQHMCLKLLLIKQQNFSKNQKL